MKSAIKLLRVLADGEFKSGQELALKLGVTRAAVWKQIEFLKNEGVDIETARGQGYRSRNKIEPLDVGRIRFFLRKFSVRWENKIVVEDVIDSTNAQLLSESGDINGKVILAEYQTSGRGRRRDKWVSPPASGICLSVGWGFESPPSTFSALGLVVGLALVSTLEERGLNSIYLKWPNDLIHDNKKLAGILIEIKTELSGPSIAVIGIGLNVSVNSTVKKNIDQDVTDLAGICGGYQNRNEITAQILSNLSTFLKIFERDGFEPFKKKWSKYDYLRGRLISVSTVKDEFTGTCVGLDDGGALVVKNANGCKAFISGSIKIL